MPRGTKGDRMRRASSEIQREPVGRVADGGYHINNPMTPRLWPGPVAIRLHPSRIPPHLSAALARACEQRVQRGEEGEKVLVARALPETGRWREKV